MTARANDPFILADRPTGVCDLTLLMPDTRGRFRVDEAPTSPRVRASLDPSADTDAPAGSLILAGDGTTQPYVMGPSSTTVTLGSLIGASTLVIVDAAGYYTTDTVEAAFTALGLQIGGDTDATYDFAESNVLTDDDAVYAALNKLDLKWGDLGSTANGEGASLVGLEDAGGIITAATVEGALAENRALINTNTTDVAAVIARYEQGVCTSAALANGGTAGYLATGAAVSTRIAGRLYSLAATDDFWNLSAETDTDGSSYRAYWLRVSAVGAATFEAGTDAASEAAAIAALPALNAAYCYVGVFVAGPACDFDDAGGLSAQGSLINGWPASIA